MNARTFQDEIFLDRRVLGYSRCNSSLLEKYSENLSTSMKEKRHDKDPGHQRGRSTPLTSGDHHVKLLTTWTYLLQGFHKLISLQISTFVQCSVSAKCAFRFKRKHDSGVI